MNHSETDKIRLIADLWTSSESLYFRKDPSGLSFSFFASLSFPSGFCFFLIRNRISACCELFDQSDVGTVYVLISPACLPSPYLLFLLPLSLCFIFRRPRTASQLQWQHWAPLWDILGLSFEIFLGSHLRYSWALLWDSWSLLSDILGLYFDIFLGSTLRYSWALIWDILGLYFEIFLGSTLRFLSPTLRFLGSHLRYSWALLWDILGLRFRIYFDSTFRYSCAPLSDNLGLQFWISLGSNVTYPWSSLLDNLGLQF